MYAIGCTAQRFFSAARLRGETLHSTLLRVTMKRRVSILSRSSERSSRHQTGRPGHLPKHAAFRPSARCQPAWKLGRCCFTPWSLDFSETPARQPNASRTSWRSLRSRRGLTVGRGTRDRCGLWLYRRAAGAAGEPSSGGGALLLCRHVYPAAAREPCGPPPAASRS